MDYFLGTVKRYFSDAIGFLEKYPLVTIVIAGAILFFKIFSMTDRKSSAGSWITILICAFLVLWALGCLTGLGFTMSF